MQFLLGNARGKLPGDIAQETGALLSLSVLPVSDHLQGVGIIEVLRGFLWKLVPGMILYGYFLELHLYFIRSDGEIFKIYSSGEKFSNSSLSHPDPQAHRSCFFLSNRYTWPYNSIALEG